MLVKYNLLNNPSNFKNKILSDPPVEAINNGKTLIIRGKCQWAMNFVDESNSGDVEKGKEYFIGYIGNLSGLLRFYYANSYEYAEYHKDLIYGKRIIGTPPEYADIFYMRLESENTELKIKKFFVTDELADIIIDKKSVQSEERQAIYPPEGNYKEIQAL